MLQVPRSEIEEILPAFLLKQRWYRAKAKTIEKLGVADVIAFGDDTSLLLLRLTYRDGEVAHYVLPVSANGPQETIIAGALHDALHNPDFRSRLLDAIACGQSLPGESGVFHASPSPKFESECQKTSTLESKVSRAEQSNSSIIFGGQYILKLFRKLEEGINPDIEIGKFLTQRGFQNTPAVLGSLEYRPHQGDTMQAGILMQFVPNEGDAWKYTLESLSGFFSQAEGKAPALGSAHPFEITASEASRKSIGPYVDSARLLGRRTAEMHAALASAEGGPDFAPDPFSAEYAQRLYDEMLNQADITFDLLRDKQNMLAAEAAEDARALLEREAAIRERFVSLRKANIDTVRIRHHGDYHLGQVLWTGKDFMIIDFEGEPARPLSERRIKTFGMRDVAGMVRSFSYAGYAAIPEGESGNKDLEEWADFWGAVVSAEFLGAYLETANNAPFVGKERGEQKLLFDAFLLQKALYEVAYELNNRPDWVRIPLRGILNLIGYQGRRTQFA